jgi:metal-sulfur cluster biosynthetic enzyme
MIDEREVRAQLDEVLDPELDRSLSTLGFIDLVEIKEAEAEVVVGFRLPTFWCAPNFAYMMAADLRERVGRVSGVKTVTVLLRDHFASDEISDGINAGHSFTEVFPGDTDGELDELRRTFAVKAFLVRQEQLLRALLRAGVTAERLAALQMDDLRVAGDAVLVRAAPAEHAAAEADGEAGWRRVPHLASTYALWRKKRAAAGLSVRAHGPLFTTADDEPLPPEGVMSHLRAARMIRLNTTFNTLLCTGLHRTRYGVPAPEAEAEAEASLSEALRSESGGGAS